MLAPRIAATLSGLPHSLSVLALTVVTLVAGKVATASKNDKSSQNLIYQFYISTQMFSISLWCKLLPEKKTIEKFMRSASQ